jgi:hypothetical protein
MCLSGVLHRASNKSLRVFHRIEVFWYHDCDREKPKIFLVVENGEIRRKIP